MESFKQLTAVRRSIRKYTDEPLTPEQVELLLRAALIAPSGKSIHPCRFVVVDDKAKLQQLSECKDSGAALVADAPLAVVVVGNPEESDVWLEDASVAATHILLQAEDLGLGACWVQVRLRHTADGVEAEEVVRELLGLPENLRVLCIVAVGHKGMERKPQNEDKLEWEKVTVWE